MPRYTTHWLRKSMMMDWRKVPASIYVTVEAEDEHAGLFAAEKLARALMGGVEYDHMGTFLVRDDDPLEVAPLDEDGKPWTGPRA